MMKNLLIILALMLSSNFLSSQEIIGYKPEIKDYIEFIEKQSQQPIDYLLSKYKTNDVIVFGERDHRDISQYYFIEELINKEEFYTQVGVIYTEIGSSNYNDTLNKTLQDYSLEEKELDEILVGIYRDISYQVFWDKYNFMYLWKTVYKFNKNHQEYPITIEMTSHTFDWNEMQDTASCRIATDEVESYYDASMAEYFLSSYSKIHKQQRNKAFVIMNYPHSLRKWVSTEGKVYTDLFGSHITKDNYYNVFFVIANPYRISMYPVVEGKWDAAAKYCGNPIIGFDFKNSPHGKDTFDVWPLRAKGKLSYKELYDGIIFINPINECENTIGVPGFISRKFAKEYLRRMNLRMYCINRSDYKSKYRWEKQSCNYLRIRTVDMDFEYFYGKDSVLNFNGTVNQWLEIE